MQFALCIVKCPVSSAQFAVYIVLCEEHIMQCEVRRAQYAMCIKNVQCEVFNAHFTGVLTDILKPSRQERLIFITTIYEQPSN